MLMTKSEGIRKVVEGDGVYIILSNVRVANGGFFDLGLGPEKKLGVV